MAIFIPFARAAATPIRMEADTRTVAKIIFFEIMASPKKDTDPLPDITIIIDIIVSSNSNLIHRHHWKIGDSELTFIDNHVNY